MTRAHIKYKAVRIRCQLHPLKQTTRTKPDHKISSKMYHAYQGCNARSADISRMTVYTLTAAITLCWILRSVFPFPDNSQL